MLRHLNDRGVVMGMEWAMIRILEKLHSEGFKIIYIHDVRSEFPIEDKMRC